MMGIIVPETCSASHKCNKTISSIKLVLILQLSQRFTVQHTLNSEHFFLRIVSLTKLENALVSLDNKTDRSDEIRNKTRGPHIANCRCGYSFRSSSKLTSKLNSKPHILSAQRINVFGTIRTTISYCFHQKH